MKVLLGADRLPKRRFSVRLVWEPRDLFAGVFWNVVDDQIEIRPGGLPTRRLRFLLVYVCVVPCVPIVFAFRSYA